LLSVNEGRGNVMKAVAFTVFGAKPEVTEVAKPEPDEG
jgi:hypothetical protein